MKFIVRGLTLVAIGTIATSAMAAAVNVHEEQTTSLTVAPPITVQGLGEVFFQIDFPPALNPDDVLNLGAGYDSNTGNLWFTGGGEAGGDGDNWLYEYTWLGPGADDWTNTAIYAQPTTSVFGWRDLTFDGVFLYGSDSSLVEQIDPATGMVTGVVIPGPLGTNRALAYDPVSDHFWTADFASNIIEFDRTGTVVNQYSNDLSIYGMAWDDQSPDGPFLWICSQDGNPAVRVSQFDPIAGELTGVAFAGVDTPGTNTAGGCELAVDPPSNPGSNVLVMVHQAEPDIAVGYDPSGDCGLDIKVLNAPVTVGDGKVWFDLTLTHRRPETVVAPILLSVKDGQGNVLVDKHYAPRVFDFGSEHSIRDSLDLPGLMNSGTYFLTVEIPRMRGFLTRELPFNFRAN